MAVVQFLVEKNHDTLTARLIAEGSFQGVPRPFMRMALDGLVRAKLMSTVEDEDDGQFVGWMIHNAALPDVYDFVQGGYVLPAPPEPNAIPAADRFVAIDHNSQGHKDAEQALDTLAQELTGKNDLFANAEERLSVVSEVKSIRDALKGHAIRVATVAAITRGAGTLAWLSSEFFSASVRALASQAMGYFIKLISSAS